MPLVNTKIGRRKAEKAGKNRILEENAQEKDECPETKDNAKNDGSDVSGGSRDGGGAGGGKGYGADGDRGYV